jgi:uncharacterized protein
MNHSTHAVDATGAPNPAAAAARAPTTGADHPAAAPTRRHVRRARWVLLAALPLVGLTLAALSGNGTGPAAAQFVSVLGHTLGQLAQSPMFWLAVMVGFSAQLIDGALGMAYGISSTTFLMGLGASPAAASGAVHVAEVFTTGLSGASHWRLGNVDRALFRRIVIPGVLGSVAGAYVLTSIDGKAIKPFVSAYLLLGLYILHKAWTGVTTRAAATGAKVQALAATGGFLDAAGGGGWGPVVTTSLVGRGHDPRTAIGTVNSAEFFVSLAAGGAFVLFGDISHAELIAGLVFGGLFAAPLGAWVTRLLSPKALLWLVGGLITVISSYNLVRALG